MITLKEAAGMMAGASAVAAVVVAAVVSSAFLSFSLVHENKKALVTRTEKIRFIEFIF
jgi:hypothetical protein